MTPPPPVRIQTPANDDTRRPAEVANDDSERETPANDDTPAAIHYIIYIARDSRPRAGCLLSLHDRHPPPFSLLTSKPDTANDDSERHPPPVVFIFRYLQENDKYICKRILKR
jgi:hypothetical protein